MFRGQLLRGFRVWKNWCRSCPAGEGPGETDRGILLGDPSGPLMFLWVGESRWGGPRAVRSFSHATCLSDHEGSPHMPCTRSLQGGRLAQSPGLAHLCPGECQSSLFPSPENSLTRSNQMRNCGPSDVPRLYITQLGQGQGLMGKLGVGWVGCAHVEPRQRLQRTYTKCLGLYFSYSDRERSFTGEDRFSAVIEWQEPHLEMGTFKDFGESWDEKPHPLLSFSLLPFTQPLHPAWRLNRGPYSQLRYSVGRRGDDPRWAQSGAWLTPTLECISK